VYTGGILQNHAVAAIPGYEIQLHVRLNMPRKWPVILAFLSQGYRGETDDYSRYVNTAFAYLHRNMSATMTFILELIVYHASRKNITWI